MSEDVSVAYLQWLHSQFVSTRFKNPSRTYWRLSKVLHSVEFIWFIHNDDNRCADGIELRSEFLQQYGGIRPEDAHWLERGCSFLEMIIALSRRLAFETEGEARDWVVHLLDTLGLMGYNDRHFRSADEPVITKIVDNVIWRRFDEYGNGGLFPLSQPQTDQRQVEIWYQAAAYLMENNL